MIFLRKVVIDKKKDISQIKLLKEGIMKVRKYSFLLIFVVFVVFFFLFCAKTEILSQQQGHPHRKLIKVEAGVKENYKNKLATEIKEMYETLEDLFENRPDGFAGEMANLLGESAVIVFGSQEYSGEIINNQPSQIEQFWSDQSGEHDKVKFHLLWGLITNEKEQVGEDNFDAKSHESFWFKFNPAGEGEGSNRRIHRDDCEWFDI